MLLFKFLEFKPGQEVPDSIEQVPGYAGSDLRDIAEMTHPRYGRIDDSHNLSSTHPRIVYRFECPQLTVFPIDYIIGYDWSPGIDNTWSNDHVIAWFAKYGVEVGKQMQEFKDDLVADVDEREFMSQLFSAIWSYKPGWTVGSSSNQECEGESIVTIPCRMERVPDPEVAAAFL